MSTMFHSGILHNTVPSYVGWVAVPAGLAGSSSTTVVLRCNQSGIGSDLNHFDSLDLVDYCCRRQLLALDSEGLFKTAPQGRFSGRVSDRRALFNGVR